jgi:hypothetical protein
MESILHGSAREGQMKVLPGRESRVAGRSKVVGSCNRRKARWKKMVEGGKNEFPR